MPRWRAGGNQVMRNAVISLIGKKQGCDPDSLNDEMTLSELGMDSLKAITLLYELEEQLGIEIPNDAIDRIETLGDVIHELNLLSRDA